MSEELLSKTHSYDPQTVECPWAYDAALRAHAPVHFDDKNDIYVVSSYDLIREILRSPERFSSRYMEKMMSKAMPPPEVLAILAQGCQIKDALLVTDGELHDRHRRMITTAFSRARLATLAPLIDARIDSLLDAALPKGQMAFREEVAKPLPLLITEQQLRIPPQDMERAKVWSEILSSNFGGMDKTLAQQVEEATQLVAFQQYFRAKIEHEMARISEHGAGERDDDLVTMMAQAIADERDPMDMDEALSFLLNLFPATHDTTTSALTACMHRFVEHAEVQDAIARDPSRINALIDETMRHESPVRAFWRRALEDVELAGVRIPAGAWILLRTSAAHRDAAVYEDADAFRLDRRSPSQHFGFGTGIHVCAGRFYARHIINGVISRLSQRARHFRFVPGRNDFQHIPNMLSAAYTELWVAFDPA